MSIHSSLRSSGSGNKHRSVLKHYERLKVLEEKGTWNSAKSALGLAKVKQQKLKIKKEKTAAAEGSAPVAGAAPAAAAPAASAGKAAAPAAKAAKTDKK